MIPIKHTALYNMCLSLYEEYESINKHMYNDELDVLLHETIDYLKLDVYQVENEIVVTFILDPKDVKNGRD